MASQQTASEDELVLKKVRATIQQPPWRNSIRPTQILPHMYIGDYTNADNLEVLQTLGINHVLNCAAYSKFGSPYGPGTGIKYEQFFADDADGYDIFQHFPVAKQFIDSTKASRGKVLVHCAMGINRSGAICAGYLMDHDQIGAIEACERIKSVRGSFLCNKSFQKQLVQFSRSTGLIRHDLK